MTMNIVTEKKIAKNYFRFMRNWDNETKKDMIIKLTKSIEEKPNDRFDFSSCFGAWEDERSADEIIQEIRSNQVNQAEIEEF